MTYETMSPAKVGFGKLAADYCGRELPLSVLQTRNGFYIGTFDDGPCSRESCEYWSKREDAEMALITGRWTQRLNP